QLWQEIDIRVHPLPFETVALDQGNNRVVCRDICAISDQPAFAQSAMDGFAFAESTPTRCMITATVAAGDSARTQVNPGEAIRILTGGMIPSGTHAIARQEDCEIDGGFVSLRAASPLEAGRFIRSQGEVFKAGEVVLPADSATTPGAMALLASAGVSTIEVHGRATALHLVTGDEIVPAGTPLMPGQTYDSNGPMMRAFFDNARVGCRVIALGDNADSLEEIVTTATDSIVLLSGGSGPGDHDHTTTALDNAGFTIHANRINSRPGKPLIFATRGAQIAFGLPGNPLAHWVCFHAFVRRAIDRLHGIAPRNLIPTTLIEPINDAGDGRRTWTPARMDWSSGALNVHPLPWKHSGDLTPLRTADALILDGLRGDGTTVRILPVRAQLRA
ncbi:MAG: molybdopterin molybdotransferase MoeA, partial [Chthoniobacterales bacterium]